MLKREIVRRSVPESYQSFHGLPEFLSRIYASRGIESPEELELGLKQLLDNRSLLGVDSACELLVSALTQDKKILIVGDFDADDNPDIIKWEKVYVSNKKTESIAWNKVRNSLTHYERDLMTQQRLGAGVTGEYLPQITPDSVIENWLSANELTWQKGFPSTSECEGEEGQLISEMHDPLLNDPDVLQ